MNKQQIKLLKEIKKSGSYDYTNLSAEKRETLFYLKSIKYIEPRTNPNGGNQPIYKISEIGKSYLYEKKINSIREWITLSISLIALIKSFFPELTWLLQSLAKVLK